MEYKALLDTVDALYGRYLSVLEDITNLESPTESKEAVDAVGRYFETLAREKGWLVEKLPLETAGDPICITMNPDAPGAPVTFSGHIDTVQPFGLFGDPPARIADGKLYGPGVTDCKGGVVAAFLAMDALERRGFTARPVKLILQTDEEVGSRISEKKTVAFMCEKAAGSVAFLNTEPCNPDCATLTRKGIWQARITVEGKATHSAECHKGANAIAAAALMLLELEKFKDPEGLTCNCGCIEGGTVPNAVPARCSFTADFRFATKEQQLQAQEAVTALTENPGIPGCRSSFHVFNARPAMVFSQANTDLLDRMNAIYVRCGMSALKTKVGTGGSDAAYTTEAGIPTVDSLGILGNGIHSVREFAYCDSLAESAKRLALAAYFL